MKNALFILIIMLFSMCNRDPGKTRTETNSLKTESAPDTATDSVREHMDSLQYYKTKRDNTKLEIIELKKFLAAKKQSIKSTLNERINEMERKLNELDNKMDNWKNSSEENWNNIKAEVKKVLQELENTIDSTQNELQKDK